MGIGLVMGIGVLATAAGGGLVLQTDTDLDKWVYPFNGTPGTRVSASTFTSLGQEEISGFTFDQRDGQFLVGFATTSGFPAGRAACRYLVDSVVVRAVIEADQTFGYDPTYDDFCTYITDTLDPDFCGGDSDAGTGSIATARPLELFGVAYRGGFGAVAGDGLVAYTETTAFGAVIQKEQRYAYPIDGNMYPSIGNEPMTDDVSNNIRDRFDPSPWAIGLADGVGAGQPVPADTEIQFTLDPARLEAGEKMYEYVRQGLRDGRLNFLITSLQPAATSSGGGPGTGEFASFFTREETIFGIPASIEVLGSLTCDGDANQDGVVDVNDISFVLFRLGAAPSEVCGCVEGDANGDEIVDVNDISYVLFRLGTCDTN